MTQGEDLWEVPVADGGFLSYQKHIAFLTSEIHPSTPDDKTTNLTHEAYTRTNFRDTLVC